MRSTVHLVQLHMLGIDIDAVFLWFQLCVKNAQLQVLHFPSFDVSTARTATQSMSNQLQHWMQKMQGSLCLRMSKVDSIYIT